MSSPEGIQERSELSDTTLINEIEPIEQGGVAVDSKEDLKYFVEAPLLEACQILFDKGIRTVFSSANKKDIGGNAYIAIDFESLNPNNKAVAESIGEEGVIHGITPRKGIYLQIPISEDSTLGEIKRQALEMVSQFEDQRTQEAP